MGLATLCQQAEADLSLERGVLSAPQVEDMPFGALDPLSDCWQKVGL